MTDICINPLKASQLAVAPTRRNKVIAGRRKGFQNKKKTELCKHYQIGEECPKGESCSFAHGVEELRAKPIMNYRTIKCRHFQEKGWCQYGPRCQFLHNEKSGEIRDFKINYEQLLRVMNDIYSFKHHDMFDVSIEEFMVDSVNIEANKLPKLEIFQSLRQDIESK